MGRIVPFEVKRRAWISLQWVPVDRNPSKKTVGVPDPDPPDVRVIKNDLGWHAKIGWSAIGIAAAMFGWLLVQYIPEKIQSAKTEIKGDVGERVAKVEDGIERLGKDIDKLEREIKEAETAFAQLRIKSEQLRDLPLPAISKKFDGVIGAIDSGMAARKPPPSATLAGDKRTVIEILSEPRVKGELAVKGISLLGRLEAYEAFGRATAVQRPDLLFSKVAFSAPKRSSPFPQVSLLQVRPGESVLLLCSSLPSLAEGKTLPILNGLMFNLRIRYFGTTGGPFTCLT